LSKNFIQKLEAKYTFDDSQVHVIIRYQYDCHVYKKLYLWSCDWRNNENFNLKYSCNFYISL